MPAPRNQLTDLRGASLVALDLFSEITHVVQGMQSAVAASYAPLAPPIVAAVTGTNSLVFASIRGVARAVVSGMDLALGVAASAVGAQEPSPAREAAVAALNGVLGDRLAAAGNPLAIPMTLRRGGHALTLTSAALRAQVPEPSSKVLVAVHGLCMNDLRWERDGQDHAAALSLALGSTAVWVHYNSGEHVSTNGPQLAALLEQLVAAWPVPISELTLLAHSLGGLVARSAIHQGSLHQQRWRKALRNAVFLGTPHQGALLERAGHGLDLLLDATPYTAPFARLGKGRSAGIRDLRHGFVLPEDCLAHDAPLPNGLPRHALPLPADVRCFAIAGSLTASPLRDRVVGDGLVTVPSALGEHPDARLALTFPLERRWVGEGLGHMDLLSSARVFERVRSWLAE